MREEKTIFFLFTDVKHHLTVPSAVSVDHLENMIGGY